jgi:hypothetical protein
MGGNGLVDCIDTSDCVAWVHWHLETQSGGCNGESTLTFTTENQ